MSAAAWNPLVDGHGRPIGDVRISVTDRCNFRCQYCMPAEGLPWLEREAVLSYEELARIVSLLARLGVHDVRLTGGEPLARRDLHRLVAMISADPNVHDLSLTTNGYLLRRQLPDLVAAGLKRLNVSLDSLAKDRFFELTRRDGVRELAAQRIPRSWSGSRSWTFGTAEIIATRRCRSRTPRLAAVSRTSWTLRAGERETMRGELLVGQRLALHGGKPSAVVPGSGSCSGR